MSTLDPGLELLRRAFASLAEDAAPGPDCPDPERLWEGARGELPPPEARALVVHTAECPACAEAWRLARELGVDADTRRTGLARTRWWGGVWPLAAALAAAVLTSGVLIHEGRGRVIPGYRDLDRGVLRAQVDERHPRPRSSCVLRWSPAGEGARYDLRVATPGLAVVYRARGLTATEHQVPAAALAGVPPGARLLWQVEATAADGTRTTSRTFVARIQ